MGGDSAGSDEETGIIASYVMPKVFKRDGYLIGYAGSFRFGKLLQYVFELPNIPKNCTTSEKLDEFMNKELMQSIKKQAKEMDLEKEEMDFDALIGINGHIFEVSNDWCAIECAMSWNAIGSGTKYAWGSLHTTEPWKDPKKRIHTALSAASEYSMSVAPPFTIITE
jgi:ATP-dependent protease HslVU (ClpYQ) peptidase subunit